MFEIWSPGRLPMLACALILGSAGAAPTPYIPASPDSVVESLPQRMALPTRSNDPATSRQQRISEARKHALALLEQGLHSGDARYLGYAMAQLNPFLDQGRGRAPQQLLLPLAMAQQARHQFIAALETLNTLLRRRPDDRQARLARATLLQVTGQPVVARQDCLWLRSRSTPLASATCQANSALFTGELPKAYRELRLAMGRATQRDQPLMPWALRSLAHLAEASGDPGTAQLALDDANTLQPNDVRTLSALADLLLRQQRPQRVLELIEAGQASPQLVLRRAIATRQLGRSVPPEILERLLGLHQDAALRGDELHLRDAALLHLELLDDPVTALALARANWEVQREFADTWLLLEAARRSVSTRQVTLVLAWMDRLGNSDRRLDRLRQQLQREQSNAA